MYAVEFSATVRDGKIEIPAEYMNRFSSDVKVILLAKEQESSAKRKINTKESGFGALSHYANPSLWEQETNAWERAVVENYETR